MEESEDSASLCTERLGFHQGGYAYGVLDPSGASADRGSDIAGRRQLANRLGASSLWSSRPVPNSRLSGALVSERPGTWRVRFCFLVGVYDLFSRAGPPLQSEHADTRQGPMAVLEGEPILEVDQAAEGIPAILSFRQRVITPRVRDVRCREEKPKCRGLSGLTWTVTMTRKVC